MPGDETVGSYRLNHLLGSGGMGHVWQAFDTAHRRDVALKLLPPHLSHDTAFRRRFLHEAEVAAGLRDPHVVPIHSFGSIGEHLYIDMALIDGNDLGSIVAERPLSPEKAVDVITQAADALDAAHRVGLVHRDVKPSNLIVTDRRGFVYLIDFGIAHGEGDTRLTATNGLIGTSEYMAPERYSGVSEPSVDIYALACVLYQCLVGRPPFEGGSVEQQMRDHLTALPPLPSRENTGIPEEFDGVIAKGMAKNPADRYASAGDLAVAARDALKVTTQHATMTAQRPVHASASGRRHSSPPDRLATGMRDVAGSWAFAVALGAVLIVWVGFNITAVGGGGFDPYPFILLNLVLSLLASAQCWLVLWSARRAAAERERLIHIVREIANGTSRLSDETQDLATRINTLSRELDRRSR